MTGERKYELVSVRVSVSACACASASVSDSINNIQMQNMYATPDETTP